ncbi:MAG: hypothetical protein KatS3mg003_1121 [Candidatus Nitrosocaldaceae archaeon]|nr:MAG: hypothetical protein KatS3mg003_1121 [Candidatus Nitrosocaldaceae archaeon]
MDSRLKKVIEEKIEMAISKEGLEEIIQITDALPFINNKEEFILGLVIGRIYNAFHYQTRRILKRDATKDEFNEFVTLLEEKVDSIKDILEEYRQI